MKVFICPDSFKGTFTSAQVGQIIFSELRKSSGLICQTSLLADGGEGSLELLKALPNIKSVQVPVHDPLGRSIACDYLILGNQAFIELASASGLVHLESDQLDPFRTNTYGTGELIMDALHKGCQEITLFLGGSATVDGGTGIVQALSPTPDLGRSALLVNSLIHSQSIDVGHFNRLLHSIRVNLVTDVSNQILGSQGAVKVFGPQKGASSDQLLQLEAAMEKWVDHLQKSSGKGLKTVAGLGAAGGAGLPLYAFAKGRITRGFDYFNRLLDYQSMIHWADVVITGEGCIDQQTSMGKGPGAIARMAKAAGKYVIGIAGVVTEHHEDFDQLFSNFEIPVSDLEIQMGAERRLQRTVQTLHQFLCQLTVD